MINKQKNKHCGRFIIKLPHLLVLLFIATSQCTANKHRQLTRVYHRQVVSFGGRLTFSFYSKRESSPAACITTVF